MVDLNDEPYVPIDIPVENTTTDENGLALISDIITNDGTLTFIANKDGGVDYESNTVNINKYDNVTISLSSSSNITSSNRSVTINGKVNGVSESVHLTLSNVGHLLFTDSQGNFSYVYQGQNAGNVTFEASVYIAYASVTIEDVYQYWKSPAELINYNFQERYGEIVAVSNGWKCTPSNNRVFNGNFKQDNISSHFYVEFKIVTAPSVLGVGIGHGDYVALSPKKGDIIKIETNKDINTTTVYMNNSSESTFSDYVSSMGVIDFLFQSSTQSIVIDEVKLKRL